jgi:hypothetical protein
MKVGDLIRVRNSWPHYNAIKDVIGSVGILLVTKWDGKRGLVLIGGKRKWIFMMDLKKI